MSKKLLLIPLFVILLILSVSVGTSDALKSEGTKNPVTNSNKVCGDKLCSEIKSEEQPITTFQQSIEQERTGDNQIPKNMQIMIDKIKDLESQIEELRSLVNSQSVEPQATSCTIVEKEGKGFRIACPDGTYAQLTNGKQGPQGKDGATGKDGVDGSSCHIGGDVLTCDDGSYFNIGNIQKGEQGRTGPAGIQGPAGPQGPANGLLGFYMLTGDESSYSNQSVVSCDNGDIVVGGGGFGNKDAVIGSSYTFNGKWSIIVDGVAGDAQVICADYGTRHR